ncbi:hypothetical protein TBLA_0A09710 [Henningerozyma blattae CBS 6284]|uniref:CBM21 domain-containing protein n=1 Tax=Henningerozyma blattae (strain ATCC 34711 / CBS 6284 / DSM 70876 / NBRC 10599 / NRRL Y-10934 / UCD 77-7) TaxID=1071380 RepID=I2GXA2_HENB6|nr:hypothetical protein TBLA_0A09710 [Tetrapisispora blattae CBS 6284]CCH58754.1 hypothetical protein TBLA_0A09710 [Tetrapisispora blattae CBS 6284]
MSQPKTPSYPHLRRHVSAPPPILKHVPAPLQLSKHVSVRFAPALTTVRLFHALATPSSLSNSSPSQELSTSPSPPASREPYSSAPATQGCQQDQYDNQQSVTCVDPVSVSTQETFNFPLLSRLSPRIINNSSAHWVESLPQHSSLPFSSSSSSSSLSTSAAKQHSTSIFFNPDIHNFEIVDWNVKKLNVREYFSMENKVQLFKLVQSMGEKNKLLGSVYVKNLAYEKTILLKLTFNNWSDIHYLSCTYESSVSKDVDIFTFILDLNLFKNSLILKKYVYCNNKCLTNCPILFQLCIQYDVLGQSYYDNNNGKNYNLQVAATIKKLLPPTNNSPNKPVQINTARHHTRRFTDDTDYFNTSPLKHLYHDDTTLIRPKHLNKVLIGDEEEEASIPTTISSEEDDWMSDSERSNYTFSTYLDDGPWSHYDQEYYNQTRCNNQYIRQSYINSNHSNETLLIN